MNKCEFSIQRFGLLLKTELRRNQKGILIFIGMILALYAISPLGDGLFSTGSFMPYIGTIAFTLPFVFYKNLFNSLRGVTLGMLPASQSEKFLVMFVLCTLVVPLGMLVFAWIVSLIGVGLTGSVDMMFDFLGQFKSTMHLGFFDSTFWSIIAIQSISIWGVCFFKSKKAGKTLLSIIGFMVFITMVGSLYGISHVRFGRFPLYMEDYNINRIAYITDVLLSVVLPVALWVWGFFKIRRQQY